MILSLKEGHNLSDFLDGVSTIFSKLNEVKKYKNQNGYDVYEDMLNNKQFIAKKVIEQLNKVYKQAEIDIGEENFKEK